MPRGVVQALSELTCPSVVVARVCWERPAELAERVKETALASVVFTAFSKRVGIRALRAYVSLE